MTTAAPPRNRSVPPAMSDAHMLRALPELCDALGVACFHLGRDMRALRERPFWSLDLFDSRREMFSGFGSSLYAAWTEAARKFQVGQARYAAESLRIAETEVTT